MCSWPQQSSLKALLYSTASTCPDQTQLSKGTHSLLKTRPQTQASQGTEVYRTDGAPGNLLLTVLIKVFLIYYLICSLQSFYMKKLKLTLSNICRLLVTQDWWFKPFIWPFSGLLLSSRTLYHICTSRQAVVSEKQRERGSVFRRRAEVAAQPHDSMGDLPCNLPEPLSLPLQHEGNTPPWQGPRED